VSKRRWLSTHFLWEWCDKNSYLQTHCHTFAVRATEKSVGTGMVATSGDVNVNNFAHLSESLARFVPPRNRQRKRRTVFSAAATHLLQEEFANDCYPDNARLLRLAQVIGHSDIAAIQVRLGLRTPAAFNYENEVSCERYSSDKPIKISTVVICRMSNVHAMIIKTRISLQLITGKWTLTLTPKFARNIFLSPSKTLF